MEVSKKMSKVFDITPSRIYQIVTEAGEALGIKVAPHDIRRTFAKLSRKAGAPIEQIQECLGHASVQTTNRYLGTKLELERGKAAPDFIDMKGDKDK